MTKGADAFRSIGEVATLLGVAPHVLRYWETQFSLLKPMKRPDGRRYYRPDDVRLAAGLCVVLRDEGLTIRGAKKLLARDRGALVRERGTARLAEALATSDPTPPNTALPSPALPGPALPSSALSEPSGTAPQIVPPDEADILPAHEPRSRLRKRHAPARLPLFDRPSQDAAHDDPPARWLADMVVLNARLRDLRPSDAASPRHRATLSRLRDALALIC